MEDGHKTSGKAQMTCSLIPHFCRSNVPDQAGECMREQKLVSSHVESVVKLERKDVKSKDYIEIGIDAEDYYRIKNKGNNRFEFDGVSNENEKECFNTA